MFFCKIKMTTIKIQKDVQMPSVFKDDLHLLRWMLWHYSSFSIEELQDEEKNVVANRTEDIKNIENEIFASINKIK